MTASPPLTQVTTSTKAHSIYDTGKPEQWDPWWTAAQPSFEDAGLLLVLNRPMLTAAEFAVLVTDEEQHEGRVSVLDLKQ